jgi:hypothetical protein
VISALGEVAGAVDTGDALVCAKALLHKPARATLTVNVDARAIALKSVWVVMMVSAAIK